MSGARRISIDWSVYGNASVITVRLMPEERAGLAEGSHVILVGDAAESREAVVTAISADARDCVLQMVPAAGSGGSAARTAGPRRGVPVDLPLDVQGIDETGLPWAFLDEAADPSVIVPGAVVVVGDAEEPMLGRVADVTGPDRRVHVDVLGRVFPADLNFVDDDDRVLARVPVIGAPAMGAVILVGTRVAWSWAQVEDMDRGWMHLMLLTTREA
ncbi:hypothetical protein [Blastococcus sp. SYSU DS1024]